MSQDVRWTWHCLLGKSTEKGRTRWVILWWLRSLANHHMRLGFLSPDNLGCGWDNSRRWQVYYRGAEQEQINHSYINTNYICTSFISCVKIKLDPHSRFCLQRITKGRFQGTCLKSIKLFFWVVKEKYPLCWLLGPQAGRLQCDSLLGPAV